MTSNELDYVVFGEVGNIECNDWFETSSSTKLDISFIMLDGLQITSFNSENVSLGISLSEEQTDELYQLLKRREEKKESGSE